MEEKDAYFDLKFEIFKVYKLSSHHSSYHRSVRLSDQKIQKLPRATKVRSSDGSSAKDLPSGNIKNTKESFGHEIEEQVITTRKD